MILTLSKEKKYDAELVDILKLLKIIVTISQVQFLKYAIRPQISFSLQSLNVSLNEMKTRE